MIPLKLKAIAFYIDKEDKVIDIGCDHAYLDIYLAQENLCKKIIASDINENALQSAVNNIDKFRLNKKIKTVLSDGLESIDTRFINTIVIAGMGCKTIKHILSVKDLDNIDKIILSSNNDQYELRKFMYSIGYHLEDEKIIYEKKHYYVVSKYIKGKEKCNKNLLHFGIYKEENKEYYEYLYKENINVLKKIPITKLGRRYSIKKENKLLKKYIKQKI